MTPRKRKPRSNGFRGWVGFVNGKPNWEPTEDSYCDPGKSIRILEVLPSHAQARKRYEDVRRIEFRVIP